MGVRETLANFIFGPEVRAQGARDEEIAGDVLRADIDDTVLTKDKVLKIPTVEACLSLIKGAVRCIPIKLYEYGKNGEVIEVKNDRRTYILNTDTGDTLNATQFWDAMIEDYFIDGNAYAYINGIGNIESLHYVDSDFVSVLPDIDPIFKRYEISVNGETYEPFRFLKILRDTKDGGTGRGIIEKDELILRVAYNSLDYENTLVKKGGNKKGFFKAAKKIGKEAFQKFKDSFRRFYANNDESAFFLNDGIDFQETSATSVELQLNENKKSNADEITKIFNIPPGMLAGASTAQTSEDDKIKFADFCIIPFLETIKNALDRDLLYEAEKGRRFFAFDITDLKKGSLLDRMKAYQIAKKENFYLVDEIRQMENKPPLGLNTMNIDLGAVLFDIDTMKGFVPNTGETFDVSEVFAGRRKKEDEGRNKK